VLLVFFLSNRVWITILTSGVLITVLSLVDYFKLLFRDDPLLASDAVYITEAAGIGARYDIAFDAPMLAVFATIVLATVFAFFFLRLRLPSWRQRGVGLALTAALCAVLYPTVYRSDRVYRATQNVDVWMSNGKVMSQWSDTDQYVGRGFLYPLIHSTVKLGDGKPDGYDRDEAAALLDAYADQAIPAGEQVSVIAVMLEAYNDFSGFGLEFETDPYEFFHQLQAESLHGRLVTNIFAGDTIDTERCFITGSTTKYEYRGAAYSYARYFAGQGYFTEFCHPCYGWFYNRQNVYEYLGFDAWWFYETRYTMPDGWGMMHDGDFFTDLAALYAEHTADGAPYFNFSVTYQNHGPYDDAARESDVTYYTSPGLSDASACILNNYLAGIHETDEALRDFVEGFRDSDKPVILVFFGDHNPWMGNANAVFTELGVNLDLDTEDGFCNYYCTPYVIWANDAAKAATGGAFAGEGGDFSPCFLMTRLFDEAGWTGPQLMQMNRGLREQSDVIHRSGAVRVDGRLTEEVPAALRDALDDYYKVQYYCLRDRY
jgi:phosphoglycerol transferase MdoB-like AlkP superfamily enzyme